MAATASYHPTSASSSSSLPYTHHRRHPQSIHHLSPQIHTSPSLHPSPLLSYSPLSSGLPSPSFPSPIPLPNVNIPRGRSPTPQQISNLVSRHPSRQQSVRRLSSISGFTTTTSPSRTPSTVHGTASQLFVDHHDFSTISEEVLSEGDVIGQGESLHGEAIELVHIPTSAARPEQSPPAVHLEVVRKLGAGSYAVVYLVKEILSRTLVDRPPRKLSAEPLELSDEEEGPSWSYEYGRDFAVKVLSKASLSPEELEIQMFEATLHQSLPTHSNIVTLYRTLQTPSFLLLVLESVPGQDLFYFLEQSRDSPPHLQSQQQPPHHQTHAPPPESPLSVQPSLASYSISTTTAPSRPQSFRHQLPSSSSSSITNTHTPPTPSLLSALHPSYLLSYARLKLITSMFGQMCDAVDACHVQGVSHRDIKPENFIVTEGLSAESRETRVLVKLSDFGLATLQQESADVDCGSAPYMSYECRNNVAPTYATQPADVWSLGIVLLNMLYHHNPWSDTATIMTTQSEIRRTASATTTTTFNSSLFPNSNMGHSCPSFSAFLASPVPFFLQRFPGMTVPVAEFLANHVFCVTEGGGQVRPWGRRASAREFGEWVRRLPGLMGQGVGLGLVNTGPSRRPALHQRRSSRLASEIWMDEDEGEEEEDAMMIDEEAREEREVERALMMLPLVEPSAPGDDHHYHPPPSTFVWDRVLSASTATLVMPERTSSSSPPPPQAAGTSASDLEVAKLALERLRRQEDSSSSGLPSPLPPISSLFMGSPRMTGTATPTITEEEEEPQFDDPSSPSSLLTQQTRSPSAKRRGKRGARRKDKSQPPHDGYGSAVQSPLLGPSSTPGGNEDFQHLDLLADAVASRASEISALRPQSSRTSMGSAATTAGRTRMSAAERALARMPPPPSMPPPPPPPGNASVAQYSALGKRLSQTQAQMKEMMASSGSPLDVKVPRPLAGDSERVERGRETTPSVTLTAESAPMVPPPAPVIKKSWRSRFGLNSSSASSSSSSSSPPPPQPSSSHASPSAHDSPASLAPGSLKPVASKSSLRHEVARGPAATSTTASNVRDIMSSLDSKDRQKEREMGGWGSPNAATTASTSPRYNDLYPGSPPLPTNVSPTSPTISGPPASTSPPTVNRTRQMMERESWRSSILSTNSSLPSSAASIAHSITSSSASSTYTRFSNSSMRSVSTMATSAASMKSDGASWREAGEVPAAERPRPRKPPGASNVKRMDGMPSFLDDLPTSVQNRHHPRPAPASAQPPKIKGVLSNRPSSQNDFSSPLNPAAGQGRAKRPVQPYEPVTFMPPYLHHRRVVPAPLDSIAEVKNDMTRNPSPTEGLSVRKEASTSTSDLTLPALPVNDNNANGRPATSPSDIEKSPVVQKVQTNSFPKMLWGRKR